MAEPLKNLFNADVIKAMSAVLTRIDGFDSTGFEQIALAGLDGLEMMQRSDQIAQALNESLPSDFLGILEDLAGLLHPDIESEISSAPPDAQGLRGWALVPVGKYVAKKGLAHPDESLAFLREMTQRFSAEFAVRPFFRDHTALTLVHATLWARDDNHHVRRLASEGSRPRLPWGLRLGCFVDDPAPLLPILETLRDDPSDYVRRSVANNLNDIAKDHPDLVARIAADWLPDAPVPRKKLIKHACRSLIKSGHTGTLAIFGYRPPSGLAATLEASPESVRLGETLTLTASLTQGANAEQPVLIDLILRFLRADGGHGGKVFKWTETKLPAGDPVTLQKRVPLRDVTTRRHYAGRQIAALQVNGQVVAETSFNLELPG